MNSNIEKESVKKEMIKKFLLLKKEFKKLEIGLRMKRKKNAQLKQHTSELNKEVVVFKSEKSSEQKCWDVIEICECQVNVKLLEKNKSSYSNNVSTQTLYRCSHPGCKSTTTSKYRLKYHQNIHTNRYECHLCEKRFEESTSLRINFRNHTGERPFECDWADCDKRFTNKKKLKQHVKQVHSNERPFQCNENDCGKSFKINSSLKRHLTTHSSLRPFQCQAEGCDRRYKTKDDLIGHIKNVHSDVKFRCHFENCQKTFKNRKRLKVHEKIHSKSKEWRCEFGNCKRIYRHQKHFENHQKIKNHYN